MLLLDHRQAKAQFVNKRVKDFKPSTYCIDNFLCLEKGNILIEYVAKRTSSIAGMKVIQEQYRLVAGRLFNVAPWARSKTLNNCAAVRFKGSISYGRAHIIMTNLEVLHFRVYFSWDIECI